MAEEWEGSESCVGKEAKLRKKKGTTRVRNKKTNITTLFYHQGNKIRCCEVMIQIHILSKMYLFQFSAFNTFQIAASKET